MTFLSFTGEVERRDLLELLWSPMKYDWHIQLVTQQVLLLYSMHFKTTRCSKCTIFNVLLFSYDDHRN